MNDCRSLRAYQCWVTWQEAKKNHVAMEQAKATEREAIDQMQRIQQDMTDLLAKTKKEIEMLEKVYNLYFPAEVRAR